MGDEMIKRYFLFISLLFGGCGSLEQTIYLQNVNVNGPLNNPPIFITNEQNSIQVSPRFSFSSQNQVSGQINPSGVNSHGFYQVDTIISNGNISYRQSSDNTYKNTQNNVNWNLPQFTAALDIDLPVSKSVSFFGSLNYASSDSYDLTGGSFGIGFKNVTKFSAIRFNLGGSIQQYHYDAYTVVVSTVSPYNAISFTRVDFYHDVSKQSNFDVFANFTFNTILPDFPVNFFCSLAMFSQTILNFSPETLDLNNYYRLGYTGSSTSLNLESSSRFLSLTPGVYMNLNQMIRLVVGFNIVWNNGGELVVDRTTSNLYVMPLAKIDFLF